MKQPVVVLTGRDPRQRDPRLQGKIETPPPVPAVEPGIPVKVEPTILFPVIEPEFVVGLNQPPPNLLQSEPKMEQSASTTVPISSSGIEKQEIDDDDFDDFDVPSPQPPQPTLSVDTALDTPHPDQEEEDTDLLHPPTTLSTHQIESKLLPPTPLTPAETQQCIIDAAKRIMGVEPLFAAPAGTGNVRGTSASGSRTSLAAAKNGWSVLLSRVVGTEGARDLLVEFLVEDFRGRCVSCCCGFLFSFFFFFLRWFGLEAWEEKVFQWAPQIMKVQ